MPTAQVNKVNLYYEVHGEGPNLVLIEGQGYHSWMWHRQVPALSRRFRLLVYDNRGVGRSDYPPGPYSHADNAADLAALLDHLGWERTHVLGVSMGGCIAQEFALGYPERLDRLVLVATMFGGPNIVPLPPEAILALTPNPQLSPEEKIRSAMPVSFSSPTWVENHRQEFDQMVAWRLEYPQPPEAAMAQLMATVNFNVENRLHEIAAPTLVVAGTDDRVVPARNAELLAKRIPDAKLDLIPGAGHLVFIEEADRFNKDIMAFLQGSTHG